MSIDELDFDAEIRERLDRWMEESHDVLDHVLPELLEEGERERFGPEVADHVYDRFHRAAVGLRKELIELHNGVRSLRNQFTDLSSAAGTALDRLNQAAALADATEEARTLHRAAHRAWRAGVATGVIGAALLFAGLFVQLRPTTPGPSPEPKTPASAPTPVAAVPAEPEAVVRPKLEPTPTPAPAPPAVARPRVAAVPRGSTSSPLNMIRHFRAESVSGRELQVSVDYRYAGDHGPNEIFVHAAALQTDAWRSRVPGTSFPEAPVGIGEGSVTINITKVPDTGAATSTRVRVCMVSIRDRSAFFCETFPFTKGWDS